jgi:hypothetical protein
MVQLVKFEILSAKVVDTVSLFISQAALAG